MSVTEFNTKILEAFVIERKVSFLLMVKYPVRNVCTNYKLKTVQNKFVKKISFQNECNVCNMELPSWFSESWWHVLFQMKRVSKWLLGLYYVLMIIGKLCRWILPMKIESYIWLMIEPKCYWVSCRKRWICNERFQNWMLIQLVTQAWRGDFF